MPADHATICVLRLCRGSPQVLSLRLSSSVSLLYELHVHTEGPIKPSCYSLSGHIIHVSFENKTDRVILADTLHHIRTGPAKRTHYHGVVSCEPLRVGTQKIGRSDPDNVGYTQNKKVTMCLEFDSMSPRCRRDVAEVSVETPKIKYTVQI